MEFYQLDVKYGRKSRTEREFRREAPRAEKPQIWVKGNFCMFSSLNWFYIQSEVFSLTAVICKDSDGI